MARTTKRADLSADDRRAAIRLLAQRLGMDLGDLRREVAFLELVDSLGGDTLTVPALDELIAAAQVERARRDTATA